jgi:hypothetical protein
MPQATHSEFLIIGAGISGLMAAHALRRAGKNPLLLDKGSGVGGRLATRRMGPGVADHGAQFFTVRDGRFQALVDSWMASGWVYVWSHGWSDGSIADSPRDGHPRYAVRGGMNALAKHIAHGLNCHVGEQVKSVTFDGGLWQMVVDDERSYTAEKLLFTPPVPQSLALIKDSSVSLAAEDAAALAALDYAPCLAGLFWIEGQVYLPEPGALQRPYADLAWIADNRRKGISPDASILTLHASIAFSREHFDDSDDSLIARFTAELSAFMNPSAQLREAQIKRWRYSQPVTLHPDRCCVARGLPLVFAGDAFGEPRVEGAALSGLEAAEALLTLR